MKLHVHRTQASAIIGLLVMLIPFSGFPMWLRTALLVICGALVTAISYVSYRATRRALEYTSPHSTDKPIS